MGKPLADCTDGRAPEPLQLPAPLPAAERTGNVPGGSIRAQKESLTRTWAATTVAFSLDSPARFPKAPRQGPPSALPHQARGRRMQPTDAQVAAPPPFPRGSVQRGEVWKCRSVGSAGVWEVQEV